MMYDKIIKKKDWTFWWIVLTICSVIIWMGALKVLGYGDIINADFFIGAILGLIFLTLVAQAMRGRTRGET